MPALAPAAASASRRCSAAALLYRGHRDLSGRAGTGQLREIEVVQDDTFGEIELVPVTAGGAGARGRHARMTAKVPKTVRMARCRAQAQ